ncbi:hypothetical protein ACLBWT_11230 [Paenibacillus sp. D51F]
MSPSYPAWRMATRRLRFPAGDRVRLNGGGNSGAGVDPGLAGGIVQGADSCYNGGTSVRRRRRRGDGADGTA